MQVDLGSTPHHIAQLKFDHPEFSARNHQLAIAFINQIRRHYGYPPKGAGLYVDIAQRAFGQISSVTLVYDENDETASYYAMAILLDVNQALNEWDEPSMVTIGPPRLPRAHAVWDGNRMLGIEHQLKRWKDGSLDSPFVEICPTCTPKKF